MPMIMASLTGCASVDIDGATETTPYFGVMRILPAPGTPLTIVHTTGFGIVPSTSGLTLGRVRETTALVNSPDECRVVFFIDSKADVESAIAMFKAEKIDSTSICEIKGNSK